MAQLILVCGKICAGKTTYAKKLAEQLPAVRLSVDELMLQLFPVDDLGALHETALEAALQLLWIQAVQLHRQGQNVVLDCGFWQKKYRTRANAFFQQESIRPCWHYLKISDPVWHAHIQRRNRTVDPTVYPVDENLMQKFMNPEDVPAEHEMDLVISVDT